VNTEPNSPFRRLAFWLAVPAAVAVCLWWSLHFPFDARRLYRAVPAESSIVTEHERLGPRWPEIARNPIVLASVGATNEAEVSGPGGMLDHQTCALIEMLASHRTVAAYMPSLGTGSDAAWVLASYAGSKAQLLRWAMGLGLARGLERQRHDGITTWVQDDPKRDAGRYLSIGVTDGIVVACLSDSREAAAAVLRRMETSAPLSDVLQQRLDLPDDHAPDRAWLRWREGSANSPERRNLAIKLNAFNRSSIRGTLEMAVGQGGVPIRDAAATGGTESGAGETAPACWDFTRRLIPDQALAVLLLEPAGAAPLASLLADSPFAVRLVASALDRVSASEPGSFAAVFHGDLGGRLLGMKVPSVAIGVRAKPGADVQAEVRRVLDILNADNKWTLFPRAVTMESGRSMTIVDSSGGDLIAALSERERPAVAVHQDWVLLSTCASTLDRLIGAMDPPGFSRDVRWARAVEPAPQAALWLDAEAAEPAVRHALAVYEISLLVGDRRKAREARRALQPVRLWSDALTQLRSMHCAVSRRGNLLTGTFAAGTERP
jgi:hypothetical protein